MGWFNRRRIAALGVVLLAFLALVGLTTVPVTHVFSGEVTTVPTTNDPDWRSAGFAVDIPQTAALTFAWHSTNGSLAWLTLTVYDPPSVPWVDSDCTAGPVTHAACSFNAVVSGTYAFQFTSYDFETLHNLPAGSVTVDFSGSYSKPLLGPGYAY